MLFTIAKKINDKMSSIALSELSLLRKPFNLVWLWKLLLESNTGITPASVTLWSSVSTSWVPLNPLHQFHSFASHIRLRFLEVMNLWIPGASVMEWHIENIINNAKEHSNTLGIMLGTFHMIFHLMFTNILCFRYFYHFHYEGEKTRISS